MLTNLALLIYNKAKLNYYYLFKMCRTNGRKTWRKKGKIMAFAKYDANKVASILENIQAPERTNYFEGLGVNLQNVTSLDSAIKLSGLDFEVEKVPMAFYREVIDAETGEKENVAFPFPNQYVTIRKDTNEPLGVVGKNYNILPNREAFDFLEDIMGSGKAKFETAGLYGGAKSFITIKTEGLDILGDHYSPYILLLNSFDGSGSVRAMFTNVRVFCSNCLARAIKNAENRISIRHSNSLPLRMESAKGLLAGQANYLTEFKKEAEKLAVIPYTANQYESLVNDVLFPINEEGDSDISKVRQLALREQAMTAYNQDDLQNFNNSAWKVIQAIADLESHKMIFRQTEGAKFANLKTVMAGMEMTNRVADMILSA